MPSILTVSHCTRRFSRKGGKNPDVLALRDVSFEIAEGEILGIAGESGSGKTTLSRLILGLEKPDEGEIRFRGKVVSSGNAAERRRISCEIQAIFQDPLASLNPVMCVEKIIAEPFRIQGIHPSGGVREKIESLLDQVGLSPRCLDKRPDCLSGGEQQRVCIARALALNPRLLVADEPVSALDAELRGEILALLKESRDKSGLSILLVAHDMSLFGEMADRIAILFQGEIVEMGRTEEILSFPRHPYTKELLSAVPPYTRNQLLNMAKAPVANVPIREEGCSYRVRCPFAADCCKISGLPVKKTDSGFYRCYF